MAPVRRDTLPSPRATPRHQRPQLSKTAARAAKGRCSCLVPAGQQAAFDVSLTAVVQHAKVLEQSGLIHTEKVGRVRTCTLAPGGLATAEQWLAERRTLAERRLDRLAALLAREQGSP